jgi:2'-5' RNA ligase
MRLFIAVEVGSPLKEELVKIQEKIKMSSSSGRFPLPDSFHITLAFLGETDPRLLGQIAKAMEDTLKGGKMLLSLKDVSFKRSAEGSLAVAELEERPDLTSRQAGLKKELRRLGINFDSKPFFAHVTLARKVKVPDDFKLEVPPARMVASKAILFNSELTSNGPIYTPLSEVFF